MVSAEKSCIQMEPSRIEHDDASIEDETDKTSATNKDSIQICMHAGQHLRAEVAEHFKIASFSSYVCAIRKRCAFNVGPSRLVLSSS